MSENSIADNKPHLSPELLKLAVSGTSDYHYLMKAVVHQSLMFKAGFIPDKTDEPLPYGNPCRWQSKASFPNIGILWVFHAADCGHFTENEARRIWRYGQVLLIRQKILKILRRMECPQEHFKFIDVGLLEINRFIHFHTVGQWANEYHFSGYEADRYRVETIATIPQEHSYERRLMWLLDDVFCHAGYWITSGDKETLETSLNEFWAFAKGVLQEVSLV